MPPFKHEETPRNAFNVRFKVVADTERGTKTAGRDMGHLEAMDTSQELTRKGFRNVRIIEEEPPPDIISRTRPLAKF